MMLRLMGDTLKSVEAQGISERVEKSRINREAAAAAARPLVGDNEANWGLTGRTMDIGITEQTAHVEKQEDN